MEKHTYTAPELEIVIIDDTDVILTSGDPAPAEVENIPWDW